MNALKLIAVALAATPLIASAGTLTLNLDTVFTGGTPAGPTPWVSAVFDDLADAYGDSGVQLTLKAPGLVSGEFVTDWAFNLNTALNASNLHFFQVENNTTGLIVPGDISTSINGEKGSLSADGLKDFDIMFSFPKNEPAVNRFEQGDVFRVDIYLTDGGNLKAADFDYQNITDGVAFSAAHIQGIDGKPDSSKIVTDGGGGGGGSIPEPSTYAAFAGLAALALGIWRHRQTV